MKLLTICIPTYNRSDFVIEQLKYLKNEFISFGSVVDIIVADNNSDLEHRLKIISYYNSDPFFCLELNKENMGLINNLYYLSSLCKSKYVWFVGDDDILLEGLSKRIIPILQKKGTYYLFLNHSAFIDTPNNIVLKTDFSKYDSSYINGKDIMIDIFDKYGTINMFITASILPLDCVIYFLENDRKKLITDPLLFSFYATSYYSLYIIKEVLLLSRYSGVSWSNALKEIYLLNIPSTICELDRYGYGDNQVRHLLKSYFLKMNNMLRFLISTDFKIRFQVLNCLRFMDCIELCLASFVYMVSSKINLLKEK